MSETFYKVQVISEKVEQDPHTVDEDDVVDHIAALVYDLNGGDFVSFKVERIHE